MPVKKAKAVRSPFDSPGVGGATFGTPTTETADARTVSVQLTDRQGRDLAAPALVWVWLSLNADGTDVVGTGATSLAAGTDGSVAFAGTTGKIGVFQSEADGDLDVTITDPLGRTLYLCVATNDGYAVSSAIVFVLAPTADFTGTPLSGTGATDVTFTDATTGPGTITRAWEKNSGSGWVAFAGTPTATNPVETFAAGTWSVRMTATNAGGSNTKTRTNYVVIS